MNRFLSGSKFKCPICDADIIFSRGLLECDENPHHYYMITHSNTYPIEKTEYAESADGYLFITKFYQANSLSTPVIDTQLKDDDREDVYYHDGNSFIDIYSTPIERIQQHIANYKLLGFTTRGPVLAIRLHPLFV